MLFGEGLSRISRSDHSFIGDKFDTKGKTYLFEAFEDTMIRQLDSRSLIHVKMILSKLTPRCRRGLNHIIPRVSNNILPVPTSSHITIFDSSREPFLNKRLYLDAVRSRCEGPKDVCDWIRLGLALALALVDVERLEGRPGSVGRVGR